ncbi:6278_t:CDS:2 [Ambispora leptoticha]|uniref:6278_t:CDS:1 n=1 Tax=Ambispora leptoticha TaxID=144679 RepID=A0A9N8ZKA7_9GLOM|nr:6278_t:CDS:2 [Ambispora leptoticha]
MVCTCFVCGGPVSMCIRNFHEGFNNDNSNNYQQQNEETEPESDYSDSEQGNERTSLYDQLDEYEKASMLLRHIEITFDDTKWADRGLSSHEFDGIPTHSDTFTIEILNFDEQMPRILTYSVIVDFESWAECVFDDPLSDYADGFGLLMHQNCFIMLNEYLTAWCKANFPEDDKPAKIGKYRVNYVTVFHRFAHEIINNNYRFNVLNHETMNRHFKSNGKFECNESEAWKISNPIYIPGYEELIENRIVLPQLKESFCASNLGELKRIPNEVLGLLSEFLVWTIYALSSRQTRRFTALLLGTWDTYGENRQWKLFIFPKNACRRGKNQVRIRLKSVMFRFSIIGFTLSVQSHPILKIALEFSRIVLS